MRGVNHQISVLPSTGMKHIDRLLINEIVKNFYTIPYLIKKESCWYHREVVSIPVWEI